MDRVRFGERSRRAAVVAGLVAMVGVMSAPMGALAASPIDPRQAALDAQRTGPGFVEHQDGGQHVDVNVCSLAVGTDTAHCDARVRIDGSARSARPSHAGQPQPASTLGNAGAYDPSYLQSAYNVATLIQSGAGRGQVVAIVDAYDSPTAAADLANYRAWFGLPALPTCSTWPSTTACFNKLNQAGATSPLPATDTGWAEEIALDLDMVSAICPNCSILLLEANSNSYNDLTAAVNEAVSLGANIVSNSYGGGEWSGETSMDAAFNHPGVAITVSSGDGGYGTEWPAASRYVTAVGGTSLNQATNTGTRNGSESAWSGAGSGCSTYEAKPTWQKDTLCANRTVADVSAVADPNTGVWVYDTTGGTGWGILGGTSVASPIVGSVYALAANNLTSGLTLSADPYSHTASLFDATGGSNGSCGGTYLCTGVTGYDGPTGLGTPNGSAAFTNAVTLRADYTVALGSSAVTLVRGGTSVSDTLTLTAVNGYHSAVTLSVSGLPRGVSASFNANPITPTASSRLSLHAGSRAFAGVYALTIKATGADGTTHSTVLSLTVR